MNVTGFKPEITTVLFYILYKFKEDELCISVV